MSQQNLQAFQVLEPENAPRKPYQGPSYSGQWDPRLITFCITNFVINVGVSQIAPFYPDLAKDKADLSFTQIGIVFAINPLGSIFFSIIIGTMLTVWGRRRCLVYSLILYAIVQVLFGCLDYMTHHKSLFLTMSMITRILQGASRAVYSTVTLSYVPLFWPDLVQKRLAVMESVTALGLLFGPIIGSLLNSQLGFAPPFFIFGTFFLMAIIPIMILLPADGLLQAFQKKQKLPIGKAFTSMKVVITLLNMMTIITGYIFFNPFFVHHMKSYGYSANQSAYIMTIPSVFYILNVNLVPKFLKYFKKSFLMSLALLVCFIGNMLEAPFYGTSDSIWPIIIGLMFVGFAQAFSTLPSIPQLMELLAPVINDPSLKNGLADMSSALFIMSMGFGSLIGPLVGGMVYDGFGGNVNPRIHNQQEKHAFQSSLLVLGGMQFVVGVVYFFFGDGHLGWRDAIRCCRQRNTNQLDSQKPLISKSPNPYSNQETQSDGVMSDDDSQPDTDSVMTSNYQPIKVKIDQNKEL